MFLKTAQMEEHIITVVELSKCATAWSQSVFILAVHNKCSPVSHGTGVKKQLE